ncbi:MAG: iron-sulfur cluster assembly accessory protein [Elusimicrobia bacterium]|nr:iron-sulfur cluster assembly accessory protein [Elusimicrobiota bacterium]
MVTLTPKAIDKVKALASSQGHKKPILRIRVGAGGCSGMSYHFEITDQVLPDDLVFESNGAKAVIDPRSDFFMGGSQVDYVESLMESGFKVQNPLSKSSCSCGQSFST